MIISRTPFRISFFGGGTDYPAWYRENGGRVLGTAINKYCWITCRYLPPFFEHRFRVVYSKIEDRMSVDEIAHPAVREVLRHLGVEQGVEIHHDGDLPARSGIGSSSSFAVGLLHAVHALKGYMPTRVELVREAIHVEQERLRDTVGSQDQVFAAHGGLNHVEFLRNDEIVVTPLTLHAERLHELNDHLMLFFTGISRTASAVASTYVENLGAKQPQLRLMGQMVEEALDILRRGDLPRFGALLHETWQAKRSLDRGISTDYVDQLYEAARLAGALGGKLLGAGGGGFLLLFARPADQPRIKKALHKLIHVPFRFDFSGSRIVFFDHEEDFSEEARGRALRAIEPFRDADRPGPARPGAKAT
ncbi:MAG: kinase [Betaproteobacteria bacterium]|nr:kinase [Betaproteobacteria bacterium]